MARALDEHDNRGLFVPLRPSPLVYCLCRQPDFVGSMTVCCNGCGHYFHPGCVGLLDSDVPAGEAEWLCPLCAPVGAAELSVQPLVGSLLFSVDRGLCIITAALRAAVEADKRAADAAAAAALPADEQGEDDGMAVTPASGSRKRKRGDKEDKQKAKRGKGGGRKRKG